jgi:hypothetical protein
MIKKILTTLLVVTLVGCDGEDSESGTSSDTQQNTPKEQVIALETSGAIPELERGTTIAGTDSNTNGIRDDIEVYIDLNYSIASQHAAAMQSAKAMQEALLVDTTNIVAVKEVNRKISRADHCIYTKFDGSNNSKQPAQVSQEIESITTNTKARLLAYLAFSKALDGMSWAMPEGDSCE